MKTPIKTFACAALASIALLACNDTGTDNINDNEQNNIISSSSSSVQTPSSSAQSSNFCENPQSREEGMPPVMDCRVVSYQRPGHHYTNLLGYGQGFTTNEEILKSWFPHIFNGGQSECNYFALYFTGSSSGFSQSYEILSQDKALYRIACTWGSPLGIITGDFAKRAMLICDDKDWTLKESIDLDYIHYSNDPNWECESGAGGPSEEEVYF